MKYIFQFLLVGFIAFFARVDGTLVDSNKESS